MKYPLLPYSQLVFDMLKANPEVYTTRYSLRIQKQDVDMEKLVTAIQIALNNHPILSMRVDEDGMQHYEHHQDIFHGQYYSIDWNEENDAIRFDVMYNRILGDKKSIDIMYEDIRRAYCGLSLSKDFYLEYLDYVEKEKRSLRYAAQQQWMEQHYGNITCSVHPKTDIPLSANVCPIEGVLVDCYSDLTNAINELVAKYIISLTGVFSLSCALALMEYNGEDNAALTWAYEGRETEKEQRIFGSLHRDVPFRIQKSKIEDRESAIRFARKQCRDGIAHSMYPFTLTKPRTEIWNYALNVLAQQAQDKEMNSVLFPIELIQQSEVPSFAYALLDVEISDEEQLWVSFRYSATHYKPESIRKFADLVRKYVEWLID